MSASSTITTLQQALNCAGKCDCCEKIQQQINQLKNKTNLLDQDIKNIIPKLNKHETRITKLESNSFRSSNTDRNSLNAIRQQLQRLKQQIAAIERYINALDNAGKNILNVFRAAAKLLRIS